MSDHTKVQKLLGPWSPAIALAERVEREAQVAWALKEDAPFEVVPPMKSEKWNASALHVLRSQLRQLIP
jgi:hypothetical protein